MDMIEQNSKKNSDFLSWKLLKKQDELQIGHISMGYKNTFRSF